MLNSKIFFRSINISSVKLGSLSGKLYLGGTLLYPFQENTKQPIANDKR